MFESHLYSLIDPSHDCLHDCLSYYTPINFGGPNIKHPCLKSYSKQSLRQHKQDLNTRYRDSKHFLFKLRLGKGYLSKGRKSDPFQVLEINCHFRKERGHGMGSGTLES